VKLSHLLDLASLSADEIEALVRLGARFLSLNRRPIKKAPSLRGKTIINLFFEPSTRTRTSFEIAGKRLSADVINISASASAVQKGETLLDTAKTLAAMAADVIVVRHSLAGAPHFFARHLKSAIVNAGDGAHAHPTQVLADLLTMQQALGGWQGKTVVIVGDIAHSRVARSHLVAAQKLGYRVILVAPKTMLPAEVERFGCEVCHDFDAVIPKADVLYMLRIQRERLEDACAFPSVREYHEAFGLTKARLARAKPEAIVMHPGPMNRGVEIASDAADAVQSRILDQVEHGVAVRMAVLTALCSGEEI